MLRPTTIVAVLLTFASAYALYVETFATRRIELRLRADERRLGELESEIAVLKAERAHLARPQRIEDAARAIGMRAPIERSWIELDDNAGIARHLPPGREMVR